MYFKIISDDSHVSESEDDDSESEANDVAPIRTKKRNREDSDLLDEFKKMKQQLANDLKKEIKTELMKEVAVSEKRVAGKLELLGMQYQKLESEIAGINSRFSQIDDNLAKGFDAMFAKFENFGNFVSIRILM